jgi:hypothetical protein
MSTITTKDGTQIYYNANRPEGRSGVGASEGGIKQKSQVRS